jgi:leader peptidase (prepilin peptidase)/N-methyltransferase
MAMAWVALLVVPSGRLGFVRGMILLIYFALVAIIDFEHRLILHRVSGLGAMLALWLGWELHGLPETLAGGITGLGVMLGLYLLGALLMGWLAKLRGQVLKEEALGFGDIILGGILGMLLGWPGILAGLMLTILLAGAASLIYLGIMLANKRYRSDLAIAYGPYMVLSGFILLYL